MTDHSFAESRPVFVLGQYRGGTTVLQRLLNSYDDILISGEHWGVLKDLSRMYRKGKPPFVEDANIHPSSDVRIDWHAQAWLSFVTSDHWQWMCRSFVRDMCHSVFERQQIRIWGFKEIRYPMNADDPTLETLAELFPEATFIFIVRDPANALASAAFAQHDDPVTPDVFQYLCTCWRNRTAAHKEFYERHRERSFWLRYEEMIEGEGGIHALLQSLGKMLDTAQRDLLLDVKGNGSSFANTGYNERWKQLSAEQLEDVRRITGELASTLGYASPHPDQPLDNGVYAPVG